MIRSAVQSDTEAVRKLWEICFPDEGGFNDYFFAHIYQPQHTLLLTQGGALCAMLQMLPYTLSVSGEYAPCTYIYGVCTHPEHRRCGYAAELLEYSFTLDRKVGRAASILIPAEKWLFEFYRPFGYNEAFFVSRQTLSLSAGEYEVPRRLTDADIPQLNALYEAAASLVHIVRDAAEWSRQIAMFDTLGVGVYGWFEGERLVSYAFCWEDNAQEAIGLTGRQGRGLLKTLSRESLTITVPGSETALGVAKWYDNRAAETAGYMNLMFN